MARRILFVSILLGAAVTLALLFTAKAQASDCTVEAFSVSPNSPSQAVGTILSLYGRGNCGGGIRASRFNIDGGGFGEDAGAPEQNETWQLTAGAHTICFEIAGGSDGNWSAGASSCVAITGTSAPPSNPTNPSVSGPNINPSGTCRWDVFFFLSGFAPNSAITVSSNYSETVCSTGQQVSSSWSANVGSTDSNGNFTYGVVHQGTGSYNYTFRDAQGNSRASSFSTSNSNPNPPVNPPPSNPNPPVNPPVNPPPSNPTTSGNNPTTGNTSPNNPTGGNTNAVPPSDPYAGIPFVGNSSQPSGRWVQIVAPQGLSVRNGPSVNNTRIGRANNGVYFQYIETVNGWHHVSWGGGEGWVSGGSQYTQLGGTNPSSAPTSAPTTGLCTIGARSNYLGNSNIILEKWRITFGGLPFLEHNWSLRVYLPSDYLKWIRKIEFDGRDATSQINTNEKQLFGATSSYLEFWIDGSWAFTNLLLANQSNWVVYYECRSGS